MSTKTRKPRKPKESYWETLAQARLLWEYGGWQPRHDQWKVCDVNSMLDFAVHFYQHKVSRKAKQRHEQKKAA